MQNWHSRPEYLPQKTDFSFKFREKEDIKISSKQSIPPAIALLDTKDAVFKNQSKTFCRKAESFSLAQLSEKNNKNNYDVECIFDDLAKTYFCHKVGNLSLKVRKSLKCYDFSLKKIFHQNVPTKTWKAVLISLLKFFCRSAKKSFKCQKNWKNELTKKNLCLKTSQWSSGKQLWQQRSKNFNEKPNFFSMSKNENFSIFWDEIFFVKMFLWTLRQQVWQLIENFLPDEQKISLAQFPKRYRRRITSNNFFFLKLFPWTRRQPFLQHAR